MRYLVCICAFVCVPVLHLGAQSDFTVQVTNTLDREIAYVFFSHADSDYWGVDLLGGTAEQKILIPGQSSMQFRAEADEPFHMDIFAVDSEDIIYQQWEVPVYPDETLLVNIREDQRLEEPEAISSYFMPLRVENQTGQEIAAWYTAPGDVAGYAFDTVSVQQDTWGNGESRVFWFLFGPEEPLYFRAELDSGSREDTIILEGEEGLLELGR